MVLQVAGGRTRWPKNTSPHRSRNRGGPKKYRFGTQDGRWTEARNQRQRQKLPTCIVLRGGVGPLFLCGLCGVRQYAWFEKLLTPLAKGCRSTGIPSPGFGSIKPLIIGAPHVEGTLGHRL
jgi:hypothetical protein